MSSLTVRWSEDAEKDLRRFDPINQQQFRLRAGDLRIRFSIEPEDTIVVLRVLPRDKTYRLSAASLKRSSRRRHIAIRF
jgi:mRNA-degrading endonuclease RelE of RelBE toxin-antitoxin system